MPDQREERRISPKNRYAKIIQAVFRKNHAPGSRTVEFRREDIIAAASELGIPLPKNVGDLIYSFRYRSALPPDILAEAPEGETWVIRPAGKSRYRFDLVNDAPLTPNRLRATTKIPDATPGIIAKYAFGDEQAVLARIRYNRLIDVFLGIACYSLQSHLRTSVKRIGQIEIDEIYVGIDRRGSHYIVPVQAKGGNDRLNRIQVEQDMAFCMEKFPSLICRPIGAQFIRDDLIALLEFEQDGDDIRIASEKHYQLASPDAVTAADLEKYRRRLSADA